ncbi:uncharacterized protein LOC106648047 [Trichogramma pretiosum]|uniref:uncharacterized protein LOC106648047 n=1 Tax=Trichogramma pretiosum TaxID=7493 RepID=UPI0006C9C494|nr:uncharacterized protein LOC106648047 [Trichogramma pretiosum]XP_023317749.1 uncharacterized protein LOC106648047 [Trichogramma pretiosum]
MSKDVRHLFVRDGQAIQITIYKGKMLNVKVNKIIKRIKLYGGQYLTWEDYLKSTEKRKDILILSDALHPQLLKYCHIYDIRWVKECIKKNEKIKIDNFRLDCSEAIENELHPEKKETSQISAEKMLLYIERIIDRGGDPNCAEYILERCEDFICDNV